MLLRAITAAVLLCGAACVDSSDEPVNSPTDGELDPDDPGQIRAAYPCEVPADAEGACALLCDPDAVIEQYVPEGTCTIFECTALDGTTVRTGGCNLL